jgi:Trk-type K+ transport system membrane component
LAKSSTLVKLFSTVFFFGGGIKFCVVAKVAIKFSHIWLQAKYENQKKIVKQAKQILQANQFFYTLEFFFVRFWFLHFVVEKNAPTN